MPPLSSRAPLQFLKSTRLHSPSPKPYHHYLFCLSSTLSHHADFFSSSPLPPLLHNNASNPTQTQIRRLHQGPHVPSRERTLHRRGGRHRGRRPRVPLRPLRSQFPLPLHQDACIEALRRPATHVRRQRARYRGTDPGKLRRH